MGRLSSGNVDFEYEDGQVVLSDIDFVVEPGEVIAVVGPTGGGKTTFVNLIARLRDTTKGSVLVDGKNVKKWKIDTLRRQIGYLLQDTFLFADTIYNNLQYGNPNVTREQAMALLDDLGIKKFIEEMPNGIDTMLKPNGANISVGQRQILAIARLILRKPKIIILDEATSNIDTKTEGLVQNAIDFATQDVTSFVIAHRLSTIRNADRIILIENNSILESGTHEELIAAKGKFYQLYTKFLGE